MDLATFHALVYVALQTTTATNALLVLSLAPIATLLGSAIIGMERPTRRQFFGAHRGAYAGGWGCV